MRNQGFRPTVLSIGILPAAAFSLLAGGSASGAAPGLAKKALGGIPTSASATIADGAATPAVAMDSEGGIYVVYYDSKSKDFLLAASKDGGKSFAPPVAAIATSGRGESGMQRGPRVGVDARKTVYVSTCLKSEKPVKDPWESDVLIAISRDGGKTFTPPVRVNDAPGSAPERYQGLAVRPEGGAHLAWLDLREKPRLGQMIYSAQVTVGPDGPPQVGKNVQVYVSPKGSVCECCDVGIAAASGGKVAIAFRNSLADGSRDAYLAVSTNGGAGFAPAVKLGRATWKAAGCPMDAPAVAGSADGKTLAAAWMDRRSGEEDPDVWWVSLPGGFSARGGVSETAIHDSKIGRQTHPALAVEADGTVIAVWEDNRPGWPAIYVSTSKTGKKNFLLSDREEEKTGYPAVAAGRGTAAVVYEAGGKIRLKVFDPRILPK